MTDDEISKVARDAFTYGTGFMRDGKHVPMENVYMSEKDAATKDIVTRLRIGAPTIEKCYEAAKRIEHLESALLQITDTPPFGSPQEIARKALRGMK